jgi:hypothetical protein
MENPRDQAQLKKYMKNENGKNREKIAKKLVKMQKNDKRAMCTPAFLCC